MKRFLSLFIALCSAAAAGAQPAEFFKNIDPYYYLEIYRPYPSEMASNVTPAPKGYEPFYISHLGRHGSRYNILVHQYEKPLEVFGAAHEAGELTETASVSMPSGRRLPPKPKTATAICRNSDSPSIAASLTACTNPIPRYSQPRAADVAM